MKFNASFLLLSWLIAIFIFELAHGLSCFYCNGGEDCSDPFNKTAKDLDFIRNTTTDLEFACQKVTLTRLGKKTIVRNATLRSLCYKPEVNATIESVEFVSCCTTNLCNSANKYFNLNIFSVLFFIFVALKLKS